MLKTLFHPSRTLSRSSYLWRSVIITTLLFTGAAVILSLLIGKITPSSDGRGAIAAGLIIPLIIIPLLSYWMFRMAYELETCRKKMDQLNRTDDLTGLLNRRHFFELAQKQLALAERHQYPVSLLLIDIDQFKDINEAYGYQIGDKVLRQTADILSKTVRGTDLLARFEGEEFILLMPHTSGEASLTLCQRMQRGLAEAQTSRSELPAVTMSVGAACTFPFGNELGGLLDAAERALVHAREKGTGRCRLADDNST